MSTSPRIVFMAMREMRSCSRPAGSIQATSVIADTCLRSLVYSNLRSSSASRSALAGGNPAQLICWPMSTTYCSIRAAALSAFSSCRATMFASVSRQEK
jgi:hypothetical protein